MKNTSSIDSTALGMILELREHAYNRNASIHSTCMNDNIFKVLNFYTLLRPEYTQACYEKKQQWTMSYANQQRK